MFFTYIKTSIFHTITYIFVFSIEICFYNVRIKLITCIQLQKTLYLYNFYKINIFIINYFKWNVMYYSFRCFYVTIILYTYTLSYNSTYTLKRKQQINKLYSSSMLVQYDFMYVCTYITWECIWITKRFAYKD